MTSPPPPTVEHFYASLKAVMLPQHAVKLADALRAIQALGYGQVTITIKDGHIDTLVVSTSEKFGKGDCTKPPRSNP